MPSSLFMITPVIAAREFSGKLESALQAAPFASVWLRFAQADERDRLTLAKTLVPLVQKHGAAALVDAADSRFAARAGADGLHQLYNTATARSLSAIRPERILGFGGLKSRDDSMTAGEFGDYVMFGEPAADGYVPPLGNVLDRCGWWAELFETPCVAYASGPDALQALAGAGADFIATGDWLFEGDAAANAAAAHAVVSAPRPRHP